MKEILLRARKDAFDVVSPETTLVDNLIAQNAGNLIFSFATQRLLTTPTARVTVDRFVADAAAADRINERFDAYVLPMANAFRLTYESTLIRLTELIRRLRIPVVILGVGSQAYVDNGTERLRPVEAAVRGFVEAVLDRGPSIGVRGELTADYLASLGYRDVDIIGCPSLFLGGGELTVEKRRPALDADARLAINVSPYVKAMGPIVMRHVERYPHLTYVPQDLESLQRLLWGDRREVRQDEPLPIHWRHPLFVGDQVRFFTDPWPWIQFLRGVDFSFGTRIHGNIAALIAGTPAVVLAHDSRTLELARYFGIPHHLIRDLPPDVDAAELYREADFGPLVRGHPERWQRFATFLARHGLSHAFADGETDPSFLTRAATTPYPPAVTVADRRPTSGIRARGRRLRHDVRQGLRSSRILRPVRTAIHRLYLRLR